MFRLSTNASVQRLRLNQFELINPVATQGATAPASEPHDDIKHRCAKPHITHRALALSDAAQRHVFHYAGLTILGFIRVRRSEERRVGREWGGRSGDGWG